MTEFVTNLKHNLRVLTDEDIVAVTHPGNSRSSNEDNYAVSVRNGIACVIIADGIGGHDYGDVASRICVTELMQKWSELIEQNSNPTPEHIRQFFKYQIPYVNNIIFRMNQQKRLLNPMGTTLVVAVFLEKMILLAHLGDSRAYRVRNGVLDQLTHDHSYISELLSNHVLNEEAAEKHPYSHVIYRSIGVQEQIETEINVISRMPSDRYMFCSDGAILYHEKEELEADLYDALTPDDAVQSILKHALEGGGEDNITAIVVFA